MPSVTKDKRTGIFIAKFIDEHGSRVNRSTSKKHKAEARALAHDWEAEAKKKREAIQSGHDPDLTVGTLLKRYVEDHLEAKGRASAKTVRAKVAKYLLPSLGTAKLDDVTSEQVRAVLDRAVVEGEQGPQSYAHLRGYLSSAIERAILLGQWKGKNVVDDVARPAVPDPTIEHLRFSDFAAFIDAVPESDRTLCLTAVMLGLRKGECVALAKDAVDLSNPADAVITVRRSNYRDRAKAGKIRHVPVPPMLYPFLVAQAERFPASHWIFPRSDGSQRSAGFKAADVVKRALCRAGIVIGFDHKCRRKGCGHVERQVDTAGRRCPICMMKLWASAVPRPITFHGLRHSAATWMVQSGMSKFAAMRIIGHSNEKTFNRYGHALVPELREATTPFLARLTLNAPKLLAPSGGHRMDTTGDEAAATGAGTQEKAPDFSGAFMVELDGIEPTTSSLQSSRSPN